MLLVLIAYVFTVSIYTAATAMPESQHNAPIAIVDEDGSPLSQRIAGAFYPPQFAPPAMIDRTQMDSGMDSGTYTFVLNIPPNFQRDVLAGLRLFGDKNYTRGPAGPPKHQNPRPARFWADSPEGAQGHH